MNLGRNLSSWTNAGPLRKTNLTGCGMPSSSGLLGRPAGPDRRLSKGSAAAYRLSNPQAGPRRQPKRSAYIQTYAHTAQPRPEVDQEAMGRKYRGLYDDLNLKAVKTADGLEITWGLGQEVGKKCASPRCKASATTS